MDAVEKRRERPVRNADARGRLPGSRPDSVRATHTQAACLGLLGPIVLLGLGLTGIVVEASSPAAFATSPLPPRAATLPVGMWTNVTPAWSPGAAIWPAMAYSPDVDRVVLLTDGANGGQTWMYDLASTNWTQAPNGTASPGVRALASMVYEPALRKFVLFGGHQIPAPGAYLGTNDTWLFDPTLETWTNVTPLVSPPTRYGQAMAYVPDTGRIVLFGGNHMLCAYCYQGGGFVYSLNDLWAYDAAADTWTNLTPAYSPVADGLPNMVYDPGLKQVFLASGIDGSRWLYDPARNAWQQIGTYISRPQTGNSATAYDAAVGSTVLFEEQYFGSLVNYTWYFNTTSRTWTNVTTFAAPEPRYGAALAYDSKAGVLVLYGGRNYTATLNETWLYRPTPPPRLFAFIRVQPANGPAPLIAAFRGTASGGIGPYTYAWDFGDGTGAWLAAPTHAFVAAGTYTVRLTVRDSVENATTASVTMTIGRGTAGAFGVSLAVGTPWSIGIVTAAAFVAAVATYWILRPRPPPRVS